MAPLGYLLAGAATVFLAGWRFCAWSIAFTLLDAPQETISQSKLHWIDYQSRKQPQHVLGWKCILSIESLKRQQHRIDLEIKHAIL